MKTNNYKKGDLKLLKCRRKIEKYNKELADYVLMTESNEVPDIDSTVIGTSPMQSIEIKETKNGFKYSDDGCWWQSISIEFEDGEVWVDGEDELDDMLRYNRRRIRKGIRVWKSENPDAELEKDDEEE